MIQKEEWVMIRHLYNQGISKTEIAKMVGMTRKTVTANLKKKDIPVYKRSVEKISKLVDFEEYIKQRLEKYNLTAQKIYDEIKQQGYQGKYGIVNIHVRAFKKDIRNRAVLMFETMPGEQAQVDWGYFGNFYDREQRRTIKLHCFFMILGYSRTLYVEFFERADSISFLKGHNHAFEYFGGYTREILYDNLKSVVIKRKLRTKDSEFNKKFIDFAGYYGFNPILCRPYKPNTKGKVEKSVDYAKRNFFAGEEFYSIKELNKKAKLWLEKINNRIHANTHEKPFDRLKKEGLTSIENKKLYDLSEVYYRKVSRDCYLSYQGNKYSVPFKYACKEVAAHPINENEVIVSYHNQEIARHKLDITHKGLYITNKEHFAGLLELRKGHGIQRPVKKVQEAKKITDIILMHSTHYLPIVKARDLRLYEEVVATCKN
jgi:transposase